MHSDDAAAALLTQYDAKLLESVAGKLFRPRIGQPADELVERILETLKNPPVVDRLLKSLPDASRKLMAVVGRSRQTLWKLEDLLVLSAALEENEGFPIVGTLLERGLVLAQGEAISSFSDWFGTNGSAARIVIPTTIAIRAGTLPLTLREAIATVPAGPRPPAPVDGLDWLLRLALARQQVRIATVKLTQTGSLYKRDHLRFTTDALLQTPLQNGPAPVDAGLLALSWARAAGLLSYDTELRAAPWPEGWNRGSADVRQEMYTALYAVGDWDPLAGHSGEAPTATITAGLLLTCLIAERPTDYQASSELAGWLWEHHPHWSGLLSKEEAGAGGVGWVEAWLQSTLVPLSVVEVIEAETGSAFRLTPLGQHLLVGSGAPAVPLPFPQTLLVQPNGELLVYRQGLTPALLISLTTMGGWKQIGAAGTLELTAETVTRGLEDGQTLAGIMQVFDRHGMKPTPANVTDLLRRWADRRERLVVYPSATLVEFLVPADLDEAISRGIVSLRLTDRIGLTANGGAPDFQSLRLLGNRDYESKPAACVVAEDDGITLRVDAAAADLLLDAEIARFAVALPGSNGDARRYRISPESLRSAAAQGQSLEILETWFMARSGESLPPAARLFLLPVGRTTVLASRPTVITTTTAEIADGIEQWPETAGFVIARLGPMALAVMDNQIEALAARLGMLGIQIEMHGG